MEWKFSRKTVKSNFLLRIIKKWLNFVKSVTLIF